MDPETLAFTFRIKIINKGLKDMKDFTIMSAQASVEARFDDPTILEGYGFSFFGQKGYTFSPVFARDHIIVQFQGHFVEEIPDDKFTVVLKKVRGEDAVPLFQTLTFHINVIHPHALHHHTLMLYEKGGELYDYLAEKTSGYGKTAISAASLACLLCLVFLYKLV